MNKWLIFDWLLGVMPVILAFLGLFILLGWANLKSVMIFGDGGLFFFSTALAGSLCGDLLDLIRQNGSSPENSSLAGCIVLAIFLVLFSSFGFGIAIAGASTAKERIGVSSILCAITTSIAVFFTRNHYNFW